MTYYGAGRRRGPFAETLSDHRRVITATNGVLAMISMLLLAVPMALAAPADWTSYLCKYGPNDTTRLVKVNENDGRVTIDGTDMSAVVIGDGRIKFQAPGRRDGGIWVIRKQGLALETLTYPGGLAKMENGTCKVVSD